MLRPRFKENERSLEILEGIVRLATNVGGTCLLGQTTRATDASIPPIRWITRSHAGPPLLAVWYVNGLPASGGECVAGEMRRTEHGVAVVAFAAVERLEHFG